MLLAVSPATRLSAAGETTALVPSRPLTDAELGKIIQMIADKGSEVRLNKEITTLLGLTSGSELLLTRGIAVKDEIGVVHQFEPLSDGKGYLILKLSPLLNTIYWINKDFALTAARSRVPGAASEELPNAEAQTGVGKELAFWAAFAREQN